MKKLKKVIKVIKKFFRGIGNFIDKVFVTPITKLVLRIGEKTDKNTGKFEKWLNKKNTLVFISLFVALFFYGYVNNQASTVIDSAAEVLSNQPVEATYNKEAYVIEGIPDTADVTLIGRTVDLYLAKQLSTGKVTVDLSNLSVGTHKVDLSYKNSINSVNYKLDPSSITVNVYSSVSHCAYKVSVAVGVKYSPDPPLLVPPTAAVYQPLNVEPIFVTVGNFILFPEYSARTVPFSIPKV